MAVCRLRDALAGKRCGTRITAGSVAQDDPLAPAPRCVRCNGCGRRAHAPGAPLAPLASAFALPPTSLRRDRPLAPVAPLAPNAPNEPSTLNSTLRRKGAEKIFPRYWNFFSIRSLCVFAALRRSFLKKGERGGKNRLPSLGLEVAVRLEVGTSAVDSRDSNVRAVVFEAFLVCFHYN